MWLCTFGIPDGLQYVLRLATNIYIYIYIYIYVGYISFFHLLFIYHFNFSCNAQNLPLIRHCSHVITSPVAC